jgi:hypothetical protein
MEPNEIAEGDRTTVIVYDRRSGEIVHVHEVITERGARRPGKQAVEREAFELARQGPRGQTMSRKDMAILHVDAGAFQPSPESTFKVDARKRRLVPVEIRSRMT